MTNISTYTISQHIQKKHKCLSWSFDSTMILQTVHSVLYMGALRSTTNEGVQSGLRIGCVYLSYKQRTLISQQSTHISVWMSVGNWWLQITRLLMSVSGIW